MIRVLYSILKEQTYIYIYMYIHTHTYEGVLRLLMLRGGRGGLGGLGGLTRRGGLELYNKHNHNTTNT